VSLAIFRLGCPTSVGTRFPRLKSGVQNDGEYKNNYVQLLNVILSEAKELEEYDMKFVELKEDNTLMLPDEIAMLFNPPEKFILIADYDGIVLKRVIKPKLSELANRSVDKNPPSLEEIADEVHQYRHEKRKMCSP